MSDLHRKGLETRGSHSEKAIQLASYMVQFARELETRQERKEAFKRALLVSDPQSKSYLQAVTDQCCRAKRSKRIADQLRYVLRKVETMLPVNRVRYFDAFEQFLLRVFSVFSAMMPRLFVWLFFLKLARDTRSVLLVLNRNKLKTSQLRNKIRAHAKCGCQSNINLLGEAVFGVKEAEKRITEYVSLLECEEVEIISVKLSSILFPMDLLDYDATLEKGTDIVAYLFRKGQLNNKRIMLDMESSEEVALTLDCFKSALVLPDLMGYSAGIAIQAYLPSSYDHVQSLTSWAMRRQAMGGAAIYLRVVKGANLAMEKLKSELKGWPQVPFKKKQSTDAQFKRILDYVCVPEHARAVHIGVASHNIFDIAYAMILRSENGVEAYCYFEMLQGMAPSYSRAVAQLTGAVLLYCPVVKQSEFQVGVAYLVRRLDENTSPENFLTTLFDCDPSTAAFEEQKQRFLLSLASKNSDSSKAQSEYLGSIARQGSECLFQNEADLDWSLTPHRVAAKRCLESVKKRSRMPHVLNAEERRADMMIGVSPNAPSRPLYYVAKASPREQSQMIKRGVSAYTRYQNRVVKERQDWMYRCADLLSKKRFYFLEILNLDCAKPIREADSEISEGIDFMRYYADKITELSQQDQIAYRPRKLVLITPPWNFSCAITIGGIVASLLTGHAVIVKAPKEAAWVIWEVVALFHDAGVPKSLLQYLYVDDEPDGSRLIQHEAVSMVVLTGSSLTARHFFKLRPSLPLLAETGGKNAMIVTAMADRDVVLRSILSSAFSYSGQKCSACSLLILEAELYDDEVFLIQLKDAVTSLVVGSSWELSVQVGPLCRDIDANLKRAMQLESGETWVVEPKLNPDNPRLMSPGVKRGVKPGSFFHQTECFGPILGIMKAKSLDHAIQIANDTPYGLTAGLQSLDEREHQLWQEKIQAGNLYINRSMTGAIVNRQPFGGIKESQFGSGFKAGGPHYLLGYLKAEQISMPTENGVLNLELKQLVSWFKRLDRGGVEEELLASSLKSYTYWAEYYRRIYDHAQLQGQSNRCRYLVCKKIAFWFQTECLSLDVFRLIGIQKLLKFKCIIGVNKSIATPKLIGNLLQEEDICFMKTSPDTFFNSPEYQMCHRLRYPLHVLSDKIAQHANQPYKRIETGPILASGHHELLRYLSEQTISIHTHRYGLTPGKGKAA